MPRTGGLCGKHGARTLAASVLTVLIGIGLIAFVPLPAAQAADRAFAARFSVNDTGDIEIYGNTLLTCRSADSGCSDARNAGVTTSANQSIINNNFVMAYVDVDSDSSTFNSSRSNVSLPSGASVLFAGLYWGGEKTAGDNGSAAPTPSAIGSVKFKAPGDSAYASLSAGTLDEGSGQIYQGFVDVTSRVSAAGNGTYTVANVQTGTGEDRMGGWSLVIAYRDTTQPARNLTVFDGLKSISSGASGSITVSGFTTPPAGDVNTTVGFVTYEGDMGLVGDSASLNGKTLSDAQHPATNFFDSRSSRGGALRTGNTPSYPNNLGIEQSMLTVDKTYVGNGTSSATIGLTSSGDVYAPGVVTFATELYAPRIDQTKTVIDVNGGLVEQGDVLRYTVSGTNNGTDGTSGFVVRDPIPTNTTYVPGSIKVNTTGATPATAATDAAGDDVAEYDGTAKRVVARMGTGATALAGGNVAPTKSYSVSFDVTVNGAIASGTTITNTATSSFSSAALGTALTLVSTATSTVKSPDLTVVKANSGSLVRGSTGTYTIDVSNVGDAKSRGTVTVTDTLPAGLTYVSAAGTGWSCAHASGTITCSRTDALATGAAYPTITVTVNVTDDVPASVANSATVSGGGDANPANNTSTDTSVTQSKADLKVVKTAASSPVAVGGNAVWNLVVTNNGPSKSTSSTVTDTLGSGLTFVSASAGCTGSAASSTVTCAVGTLASGASTTLQVTTKVNAGQAGKTLGNSAAVAGHEPDPTPGNNSSSATVAVKAVDLKVTNTIQGSPAQLTPGQQYTWLLDVTNLGGSPAADSVVRFTVPTGLTVVAAGLDSRCVLDGGDVVCALGTVAGGASVPQIEVKGTVSDGPSSPAAVATTATVTTTETDADTSNNSATTTTPVSSSAVDLGVTLTPDNETVQPGNTLVLTAVVSNAGPGTPVDATLTFHVPAGTSYVAAPGCSAYDSVTGTVTCVLDKSQLAPGESITKTLTVLVGSTPLDTITGTATVTTTSDDTDPGNNEATTDVGAAKAAGLSVVKTVNTDKAGPGDVVTYTIKAANSGPATAKDVVVTDTMPAGVTLVSASTGTGSCTTAGQSVSCDLGDLADDASATVTIRASVDAVNGPSDGHDHQLDVTKVENHINTFGVAESTITAACPTGYWATDGSVRFDAVDWGTGTFADVSVRASQATPDGTGWTGTVRSTATGQFQGKVNVVCMTKTTVSGEDHRHDVVVTGPLSAPRTFAAAGTETVELTCGPGTVAITPGWGFGSASGLVRGSQHTATGWKFTVDVTTPGTATFSVRCLSTTLATAHGHTHDLQMAQMEDVVTVPAGETVEKRLTCVADDAKGIVASWDMDKGLVTLGNDPQPKTRVFKFFNPTNQTLTARIGLLCMRVRTVVGTGRDVVNTAHAQTASQDASGSDDASSAAFRLTDTPIGLVAAPRAVVSTSAGKTRVSLPITTNVSRKAVVRLLATSKVPGTSVGKGGVLAKDATRLVKGKHSVRLLTAGKVATALRSGSVTKVRLVIATADGGHVTRIVRLVR